MKQSKMQKKAMRISTRILSIILIILLTSCTEHTQTTNKHKQDHCYLKENDDGSWAWYIYYLNTQNNQYYDVPKSDYIATDTTSTSTQSSSTDTVTNHSEGLVESTGQDVGGTDVNNDSQGTGMSESSGTDSGGSDSSGGDSGGFDGGGGGE
jgi:uncharacterized membrane protein YgcG